MLKEEGDRWEERMAGFCLQHELLRLSKGFRGRVGVAWPPFQRLWKAQFNFFSSAVCGESLSGMNRSFSNYLASHSFHYFIYTNEDTNTSIKRASVSFRERYTKYLAQSLILRKSSIFCCSVAKSCLTVTPCQASLSLTISRSLPKVLNIWQLNYHYM